MEACTINGLDNMRSPRESLPPVEEAGEEKRNAIGQREREIKNQSKRGGSVEKMHIFGRIKYILLFSIVTAVVHG